MQLDEKKRAVTAFLLQALSEPKCEAYQILANFLGNDRNMLDDFLGGEVSIQDIESFAEYLVNRGCFEKSYECLISYLLPCVWFDAEIWLFEFKDISNHPIVMDRKNENFYEVADLLAEFANFYCKKLLNAMQENCSNNLKEAFEYALKKLSS